MRPGTRSLGQRGSGAHSPASLPVGLRGHGVEALLYPRGVTAYLSLSPWVPSSPGAFLIQGLTAQFLRPTPPLPFLVTLLTLSTLLSKYFPSPVLISY